MFARIPAAALVAGLVAAPLVTGLTAAQAAPAPSAATAIAAAHYDDQGQDGDQGDAWFIHHCKQRHEWWLSRCQRDRGDMWHRGDPPSTGSW
ncbi:hypothetical protein [Nocardia tengchongensis]|uniref:hypothetical protein n=1 Tax=Nocardia tengchongensis TaxID=2055889 RepID=UPI003680E3ED